MTETTAPFWAPAPPPRRRVRRALLTGAGALATAGVGAAIAVGATVPASAPTPAPVAVPAVSSTPDVLFLGVMRERTPFVSAPDGTLIALGHAVCSALDRGVTSEELVTASAGTLTPYDAGWLQGASTSAYCPWNRGRA